MAFTKDFENVNSSADNVSDRPNHINCAVHWHGDDTRHAWNSMKSTDTASSHLPNFSIGDEGNNSIYSKLQDNLKTFEQHLHTLDQDLEALLSKHQVEDVPPSNIGNDSGQTGSTGDSTYGSPAHTVDKPGASTDLPSTGTDKPGTTTDAPGTVTDTPGTSTDAPSKPNDKPTPTPTDSANPGQWSQQTINGMKYDVLLPANYDPNVKYPTVLYLHQLDMGTDEPDLLNEVNPWFNSSQFRSNNPAIIVMPLLDQSADPSGQTVNFGGVSGDRQAGQDNAIAALKQVESQYSVDASRVYVTGNSLGGIGTWDMLTKYNAVNGTDEKIFAAGMPLAGNDYAAGGGNPDPSVVNQLKDVPIWAIHGADDQQVPNTWDRALAQSLANDPNFHYTELATGHDVWDTIYPDQNYWTWLFKQQASI